MGEDNKSPIIRINVGTDKSKRRMLQQLAIIGASKPEP
jgi:hypothetical protein